MRNVGSSQITKLAAPDTFIVTVKLHYALDVRASSRNFVIPCLEMTKQDFFVLSLVHVFNFFPLDMVFFRLINRQCCRQVCDGVSPTSYDSGGFVLVRLV
jgi:hypothetical protein